MAEDIANRFAYEGALTQPVRFCDFISERLVATPIDFEAVRK